MTFEHCATKSLTLSEHEQECRVSKLQLSMKLRQPETSESDEEEVTDEEADGDEESDHEDDEEEDGEYEDAEDPCIFPIAIPMRHRRNLLKEAGCLVDNTERIDCQFIRSSREGKAVLSCSDSNFETSGPNFFLAKQLLSSFFHPRIRSEKLFPRKKLFDHLQAPAGAIMAALYVSLDLSERRQLSFVVSPRETKYFFSAAEMFKSRITHMSPVLD